MIWAGECMQIIVVEDLPVVRLGMETALAPLGRPVLGLSSQQLQNTVLDQPSFLIVGPFIPVTQILPWLTDYKKGYPTAKILFIGSPPGTRMLDASLLPRIVTPQGFFNYVQAMVGEGEEVPPLSALSRREQEILGLLSRGLRNREIASSLGTSEKTVRNALVSIFRKLQLESRAEAILWAHQQHMS